MTNTLTPTCLVCGLRFENRPILELHVREDHRKRGNPADPGLGNPAGPTASRLRHRSPANEHGESPTASGTKAGPGASGHPRPRRLRAGRAMTALRRLAGGFQRANAELLLASEAMLRLPGGRTADPAPGRPARRAGCSSGGRRRTRGPCRLTGGRAAPGPTVTPAGLPGGRGHASGLESLAACLCRRR